MDGVSPQHKEDPRSRAGAESQDATKGKGQLGLLPGYFLRPSTWSWKALLLFYHEPGCRHSWQTHFQQPLGSQIWGDHLSEVLLH